MSLVHEFDGFLDGLAIEGLVEEVADAAQDTVQDPQEFLKTYVNEARMALTVIEPYLDKQLQILEVGSGLCVLALFLKSQGYAITALEPAMNGFEAFDAVLNVILDRADEVELEVLREGAHELNRRPIESFDLIFSINVIEHIPDLEGALDGMLHVLRKSGRMVHSCPNYSVPYEPHLRIPVVRRLAAWSEFLFKRRVARYADVWASLNFITHTDVRRYAAKRNLEVSFEKAMLYKAFARLNEDEVFRERQSGSVVTFVHQFLERTRLMGLLKYLPAGASTPMTFELSKREVIV